MPENSKVDTPRSVIEGLENWSYADANGREDRKDAVRRALREGGVTKFVDLPLEKQLEFVGHHGIEVPAPTQEASTGTYHTGGFVKGKASGSPGWPGESDAAESHAPRANTPAEDVQEAFQRALEQPDHPYHQLAWVMLGAYEQAALGKGKDRHANDLPFDKQRMQTIARGQGNAGGLIYQVCKKAQESERMEKDAKVRELQGVIVYAAGAIVFAENSST